MVLGDNGSLGADGCNLPCVTIPGLGERLTWPVRWRHKAEHADPPYHYYAGRSRHYREIAMGSPAQ